MTGHTLGAAGACEAAFLWLTLHPTYNAGRLPLHVWDGVPDPEIPSLNLITSPSTGGIRVGPMLSNSFAFGGSNVSVILGDPMTELKPCPYNVQRLLPQEPPMLLLDEGGRLE